jgi:hypothetical protein
VKALYDVADIRFYYSLLILYDDDNDCSFI